MGSPFDERFDVVRDQAVTGEESVEAESELLSPQYEHDAVSLLRLGYIRDDFTLYGHTFVMRTLTIEEEIEVDDLLVAKFASYFNEKAAKTAHVAACLELVDGEPLVRSLGMGEGSNLPRVYDRVKKWHRPIIEKLFEHYQELERRQREALAELEKKDEPGLSSSLA